LAIEERSEMDLRLPGIILTVTGILAIVITLTRGPNLGMSRRTGLIAGILLLVLGVPLLTYAIAVPQ
jgi:thiamine transporter ThiT